MVCFTYLNMRHADTENFKVRKENEVCLFIMRIQTYSLMNSQIGKFALSFMRNINI